MGSRGSFSPKQKPHPYPVKDDDDDNDDAESEYVHTTIVPCATLSRMTLHETIKSQIPDAMRAKDEVKLRTLRSLVTMMTNEVITKKGKPTDFLGDEDALAVVKRAASQRKDSIEQFDKAGRGDLSEPEKAELAILESYLPAMMPYEEVLKIATAKAAEMGVSSKSESGKFMGALMKDLKGQADGNDVKKAVDSLLS